MNKNLLIGAVLLAIVVIGYFMFSQSATQPVEPTQVPTEEAMEGSKQEFTVALSEQNASGESGTAILMEEDGKVKVTLDLTGTPEAVSQPAHIHVGACPDVGAVKYPLTSSVNGISETTLDVTLDQLRSELPLGINVHKSADEAGVYVSCGNLVL
ncbi:MAG: hypothetical protein HYT07_00040 [Candidatus Levybacteria bacterium]|nr:hypothetical protein [Candidatus Levybacteria bacterium]